MRPVFKPPPETGPLLRLAGPIVVSRLSIMLMGLCDAIVVGRYSSTELAYQALGWAPTSVVLVAAIGLLSGVQVLTARHVGAGEMHRAGAVLRRGLSYGLWIGLASAALVFVAVEPFLLLARQGEALAGGAGAVARVLGLSLPFYLVYVAGSFFMEGLSRPRPAMVIILWANVLNLALNLVIVPGLGPVPAMGAVGSAWTTLIGRAAMAAAMLWVIWTLHDRDALGVRDKPRPDRTEAREQRRIGYAAGLSQTMEAGAFASMNLIAGLLGALAVAAYAIVLNVASLVFMVPLALASATGVLVAQAAGRADPAGMGRAAWTGVTVAGVYALGAMVVALAAPRWIASAYATDPALIVTAAGLVALAAWFFFADCLQVVAAQALRSGGVVWLPTASHFIAYVIVMPPVAYWLAIGLGRGVGGVVEAIILASVVSAAILVAVLVWAARTRWRDLTPAAGEGSVGATREAAP
jgi:MATE family multidrug resistance protein